VALVSLWNTETQILDLGGAHVWWAGHGTAVAGWRCVKLPEANEFYSPAVVAGGLSKEHQLGKKFNIRTGTGHRN
jgi:hypothetical protein